MTPATMEAASPETAGKNAAPAVAAVPRRSRPLRRPRLCFVGPMVGRPRTAAPGQAQTLAELFTAAGFPVLAVSASKNRYVRLLDILATLVRSRRRIDLVVLGIFTGPSFVVEDLASRLAKRLRLPLVMVLRGGSLPEFLGRHPKWGPAVLRRADRILTPSSYLARATAAYGLPAQVVPNVIDLSLYPYRRRDTLRPELFWMRALHPIYNPEMAVRVVAELRKKHPAARLVMAGPDMGSGESVRRLITELGLEGAVRLVGYVDPEAKVAFAGQADLFINTNRIDNMPVSVVEACAMGLPVVATEVGGIPDLLTGGETALLVPSEDEAAMTAAVERLLGDARLAGELSESGRALAERSSWDRVRPQWEELFQELCG